MNNIFEHVIVGQFAQVLQKCEHGYLINKTEKTLNDELQMEKVTPETFQFVFTKKYN